MFDRYRMLLLLPAVLLLGGCAVYGDGYGYRDHHHYYNGYRRDYSPPVYVAPRYYYYDDRRRHDGKRYVPAPPRHQGFDRRDQRRHDGYSRHDGRRHDGYQQRQHKPHKQHQSAPAGKRWEGHRQQQVQQRYSRDDRHSRGEQRRH